MILYQNFLQKARGYCNRESRGSRVGVGGGAEPALRAKPHVLAEADAGEQFARAPTRQGVGPAPHEETDQMALGGPRQRQVLPTTAASQGEIGLEDELAEVEIEGSADAGGERFGGGRRGAQLGGGKGVEVVDDLDGFGAAGSGDVERGAIWPDTVAIGDNIGKYPMGRDGEERDKEELVLHDCHALGKADARKMFTAQEA